MKRIKLTQGQVALVDDNDFSFLSLWKWYAAKTTGSKGFYAVRKTRIDGVRRMLYMHRVVADRCGITSRMIDHRNRNSLDNRRHNLRAATPAQSSMNRNKWDSSSRFKGVSWHTRQKKWTANIRVDRKLKHLGSFNSELDAARAYDTAARKSFGSFAKTNFKK